MSIEELLAKISELLKDLWAIIGKVIAGEGGESARPW